VAGGSAGVSAFQMDIKVEGITLPILAAALAQAGEGRAHILQARAGRRVPGGGGARPGGGASLGAAAPRRPGRSASARAAPAKAPAAPPSRRAPLGVRARTP
jgi:hypothetical protein